MNTDHAVVDLAETPQPLPRGGDGLVATLARSGLVHDTDRLGVSVFVGDELLAPVTHLHLIPLDRFDEALSRARRGARLHGDRFDVLALQVR